MKRLLITSFLAAALLLCACSGEDNTNKMEFGLVIHGGAGVIKKENMTSARENEYREKLTEALAAGYKILEEGGNAVDAVEQTIIVLENSPLFNAGKGAVFTSEGKNELDASIMDGSTGQAGAVAIVTQVKNPISLAKAVMKNSKHVLLAGNGAEIFARQQNIELVDTAYFFTENRYRSLQNAKDAEAAEKEQNQALNYDEDLANHKFGTVGCVALDKNGNLAAGTSTGGMTNKKYGRIGDSPIIGAGTWADNTTCAVSGTGHGEYFIRNVVAYDIAARMKYSGQTLQAAAGEVINVKLKEIGGEGGVIALDKNGNFAFPFNTEGMFRGFISENGVPKVLIYKDEL